MSWDHELLELWDACAFSPALGESHASECLTAGEDDSETLPSNQETYGREYPAIIDNNRALTELIRSGFKTIEGRIAGIEKSFAGFAESLDSLEKKQRFYNQSVMDTLQQHTITHKHIIASQRLLAGGDSLCWP